MNNLTGLTESTMLKTIGLQKEVMKMEIKVRELRADDFDDWKLLWEGYLSFYGTTLSEAIQETYWARLLSNKPHEFRALVAIDAKENAVGLAHYLFHRHGWHINDVCYLQDLFVAPQARRQGVATQLIEAVYRQADKHQAAQVYWLTQTYNAKARLLYDKVAKLTSFIKYQR